MCLDFEKETRITIEIPRKLQAERAAAAEAVAAATAKIEGRGEPILPEILYSPPSEGCGWDCPYLCTARCNRCEGDPFRV